MTRKNGKKPAAELMAERAEEQAKKAQAAEMLGPQGLPGPSDGLTAEQVSAAIVGKVDEGPISTGDLMKWTRARFGVSMEVATGLVSGEIHDGRVKEGESRCYTPAALERVVLDLLKDCEKPWDTVQAAVDEVIGAPADSPAVQDVDDAIQRLWQSGAIRSRDEELLLSIAPQPVAEAIAEVAKDRPDLVEGAGTPESDAKEAHDDARDLRQDSKSLVSVMDLLRRRKSVKDEMSGLKGELKELRDELTGIESQLDQMGARGLAPSKPAEDEATEDEASNDEPEDQELPFATVDAIEAAAELGAAGALVT